MKSIKVVNTRVLTFDGLCKPESKPGTLFFIHEKFLETFHRVSLVKHLKRERRYPRLRKARQTYILQQKLFSNVLIAFSFSEQSFNNFRLGFERGQGTKSGRKRSGSAPDDGEKVTRERPQRTRSLTWSALSLMGGGRSSSLSSSSRDPAESPSPPAARVISEDAFLRLLRHATTFSRQPMRNRGVAAATAVNIFSPNTIHCRGGRHFVFSS